MNERDLNAISLVLTRLIIMNLDRLTLIDNCESVQQIIDDKKLIWTLVRARPPQTDGHTHYLESGPRHSRLPVIGR
jgi:hypothetical protein